MGKPVNGSVYFRFAWATAAVELISAYPLGAGQIKYGFGHLADAYYGETKLKQSLSGWLDLTLGIGLPGMVLILAALLLVWWRRSRIPPPWRSLYFWLLAGLILFGWIDGIASEHWLETVFFVFALGAGLTLCPEPPVARDAADGKGGRPSCVRASTGDA